jgi:FixJ family two-component response regulator
MSGPALARRLAPLRPEMRVLFMSGYADLPTVDDELARGAAFLQKPITPSTLAEKVREVLDGPASRRPHRPALRAL